MTTATEPTNTKQVPAFYIFDSAEADGKKQTKPIGAAFAHKKGAGLSLLIAGKRYAAFPPKAKAAVATAEAQATGETGA